MLTATITMFSIGGVEVLRSLYCCFELHKYAGIGCLKRLYVAIPTSDHVGAYSSAGMTKEPLNHRLYEKNWTSPQ